MLFEIAIPPIELFRSWCGNEGAVSALSKTDLFGKKLLELGIENCQADRTIARRNTWRLQHIDGAAVLRHRHP